MPDYKINVAEIEELQTIRNTVQLETIFDRARSTVVQGGLVYLVRRSADGSTSKFDEISTEEDLARYKQSVFKYL